MDYKNVKLSGAEKIALISNLSTMFSAGIAILEAVDSLLEDAHGPQQKILQTLKEDLVQGKRIWSSFAKFPRVFDSVSVSVIKASEEAGTLDVTLKDLKDQIRNQLEFDDKIKGAMIYPVFILIVFLAVFLVILLLVIPKVATVFTKLNFDLPLPTKILIFLSNLLIDHGLVVILVLALVIVLGTFIFRTYRSFFVSLAFSLPLISNLVAEIDLTKLSRSLYLLLSSGIPITQALELTKDVVVKRRTAQIIENSKQMVLSGKKFSQGLKSIPGGVPSIVIKLVEAGEKTGTLDKSLGDIAEYFDYQVSNSLKTLLSLIEPVMLVVIGITVGGMMLSIIAPIYGLISQIGSVR